MPAPMISDNWAALLTPGLRKVFRTRMRARDELFKRTEIFPTDTSQRAYEEYQGIGELDSQGWNEFERTGRVPYDAPEPGFKQRLEHREFAKGVQIKRKLMDDNLYPGAAIPKSITQRVEQLADSSAVFREKSAAGVFVNAFTDSGTDAEGFSVAGPDGVGLISTAHPNGPGNSTTQSNEFTLALTGPNLITVKSAMRSFGDDRGELFPVNPDTLLVPPELEETALTIVNSDRLPGGDFNDINPNKGRYNVVVWDYLTDSNAWFLMDSFLKSQHLVWLDRIMPEFNAELDSDTMIGKWIAYQRFSRGWDDWRWVAGSNPS